jgi:type I restriction enzyme S subunit
VTEFKPYDSYRVTAVDWAPRLPYEWRETRLQRIALIYAGGTPDRANPDFWTNGDVPWLNSGAVNDRIITSPSELITQSAATGSSTRWAHAGSVVVALAGQGKTKGMAARLEISSTFNQSMAAIVPNAKVADYRYIEFWLAANYQSLRNLAGGDLRDGLNLQHVGSIQIPLPSLREQVAIAEFLGRETAEIDGFIADQEELIALLAERRRAAQTSILSSADDFSKVRLRYLFRQSREDDSAGSEVLSVYRDFGVIQKSSRSDNMNKTPEDVSRYLVVRPDYLVVNKMKAWQGSLGVSRFDGIVSPDYEVLMPTSTSLLPEFAHQYLRSPRMVGKYAVRSVGIRPSQWRLYWDQLRDLEIPIPPAEVQARITSEFRSETAAIDAAVSDAREAIALSQERRAALISAAVTGKIDVREYRVVA